MDNALRLMRVTVGFASLAKAATETRACCSHICPRHSRVPYCGNVNAKFNVKTLDWLYTCSKTWNC